MKKFKIIRNILIIIAIIIATVYVLWIRSNQTNTSKTANLFEKMYQQTEKHNNENKLQRWKNRRNNN